MGLKTAIFGWFITFLVLIAPSEAYSFSQVRVDDTLYTDNSINETIELRIVDNSNNFFSFALPDNAEGISVNGVIFNSSSSIEIPLLCTICNINISYSLSQVVEVEESHYTFSRTLNFPLTPNNLEYRVKLPVGYGIDLNKSATDPAVVPSATSVATDGQNIIVIWRETKPQLPIRYFLRYTKSVIQPPSRPMWFFWLLGAVLILAFGAAGGYFFRNFVDSKHPAQSSAGTQAIPEMLLSPDEKTVLKLLIEHKNQMNQREAVEILGWSKSKVSAIMSNLEYKTIIKREKFGRNYKVTLVKEILWNQ
jgi:uncharacterized membrane protein